MSKTDNSRVKLSWTQMIPLFLSLVGTVAGGTWWAADQMMDRMETIRVECQDRVDLLIEKNQVCWRTALGLQEERK